MKGLNESPRNADPAGNTDDHAEENTDDRACPSCGRPMTVFSTTSDDLAVILICLPCWIMVGVEHPAIEHHTHEQEGAGFRMA